MSSAILNRPLLAFAASAAFALAAAPVQAQTPTLSGGAYAGLQLAFNGCGHNYYRAPDGRCDIVRNPNRDCPHGFHSVPAPTPSGYRCVQNGY